MASTPWDEFFGEKMLQICNEKKQLLDIGAGVRAIDGAGNRFDPTRAWLAPHLEKLEYKIMDPVPDYNPDVVGDIHQMPFEDNSQEAIACLAVLEHIENPIQACKEVYRVLEPGGYAIFYVPFLFYYHAEPGYYKDYWRFTHDSIEMLFRDFSSVETKKVRGAVGTWIHISPLGRIGFMKVLARFLDKVLKKTDSNQVSGYYIFAKK